MNKSSLWWSSRPGQIINKKAINGGNIMGNIPDLVNSGVLTHLEPIIDNWTLTIVPEQTEVNIMERSIMNAIARLGTTEILKNDSEIRIRFGSFLDHIRKGSDEMVEVLDAVMTEGADVIDEIMEAKEDLEFILDYFLKTGMDLKDEITKSRTLYSDLTGRESRFIDSMASRILHKAKEQKLL